MQSDFARAGEGDEAGFGMRDHSIAEAGAGCREQKFTTPSGMPASSSSSTNLAAMVGESLEGLKMTVLPVTSEARVMPAMMAQREVPGWNHHAHA